MILVGPPDETPTIVPVHGYWEFLAVVEVRDGYESVGLMGGEIRSFIKHTNGDWEAMLPPVRTFSDDGNTPMVAIYSTTDVSDHPTYNINNLIVEATEFVKDFIATGGNSDFRFAGFADARDEEADYEVARQVLADETPISVEMPASEYYTLISAIQLASRHPALSDWMMTRIETTGRRFQEALSLLYPDIYEIIEMGWDTSFDIVEDDED